jgi:hypothetical protein
MSCRNDDCRCYAHKEGGAANCTEVEDRAAHQWNICALPGW